MVKFER